MEPRRRGLKDLRSDGDTRVAPRTTFPAFQPELLSRAGRPIEVIVIGAGLAGLSAAYQLAKAGHRVKVLEARDRVGGKVHTIRDPYFEPSFLPEAGALLIPGYHTLTTGYTDAFGLTRRLVGVFLSQGVAHLRGKTFQNWVSPGIDWPVPLRRTERAGGYGEMWDDYVTDALADIGDPRAADWPSPAALAYDRISFAEFLRQRGASPGAIEVLRLGYPDVYGDGIDSVSALSLLRDFALSASGAVPLERQAQPALAPAAIDRHNYFIVGGNDQLPRAFASSPELRHNVVLGAPVRRISQTDRRVFVKCTNGDEYTADRAICAVPFSVLRRMTLPGRISATKRRAIRLLDHTSATRIWVQTKAPVWTSIAGNGLALTDLPAMFVSAPSFYLGGSTKGLLEALITGRNARAANAMGFKAAVSLVIRSFDRLYPGVARIVEHAAWHPWDAERWSRGDYPAFRPGDIERLVPGVGTPEGRIHFAGEHTSVLPGWMQGALESGHRAASEVHFA